MLGLSVKHWVIIAVAVVFAVKWGQKNPTKTLPLIG